MKDIVILVLLLFSGYVYYMMATSRSSSMRQAAFYTKIAFLTLSLLLAFFQKDFFVLDSFAFGGRSAVMMIIEMEIADAFVERKNNK